MVLSFVRPIVRPQVRLNCHSVNQNQAYRLICLLPLTLSHY